MSKKILIVEDDEDFLNVLNTKFSDEGFLVVLAKDGEEGLAQVQKEKPDLIILDILMPKLGGIDLAKKIKEAGVKAPMMFLTNVKDTNSMSQAFEVAASDYIIKSDMHISDIVARVKTKLGIK